MKSIGVIGGGAWGTALAAAAARAGSDVLIWAYETDVVDGINADRVNARFLPDVTLPRSVSATGTLSDVLKTDAVLFVTPAQLLRKISADLSDAWPDGLAAVICSKGIEQGSCALMSEVLSETLPNADLAVLSGPTFAIEVARGLPTGVTLACQSVEKGRALVKALATPFFRPYRSTDIIGAQVGGAVKNVLAVACGIVEGKGLGDNARAALITRGMTEIARMTLAKGGELETLMGLSGIGDVTLTCSAMQSRNFSLGVALGQGQSLDDIMEERNTIAEGVFTAKSVHQLAGRLNIDMPLCEATYRVLHEGLDLDDAIQELLARPVPAEIISHQ